MEYQIGGHYTLGAQFVEIMIYHSIRLSGYGCTLVKHSVYFSFQSALRPSLISSHSQIKFSDKIIFD